MFQTLLKQLAAELDSAGLPYMIFGGQAVLLYGEARFTRDIDVTLGVDTSRAESLLQLIARAKWRILVTGVEDFLRQTFVLPVMDPLSNIRIDFVFSLTGFERQAIERATTVAIDGVNVRFVSLEDLIVMKAIAGRPRDLEDIVGVLRKNREYDRGYVEHWLKQFDSELDGEFLAAFEKLAAQVATERGE